LLLKNLLLNYSLTFPVIATTKW